MNHDQALPADTLWDALLRFSNVETYVEQSTRFKDGQRAEPAPREWLSRELRPA